MAIEVATLVANLSAETRDFDRGMKRSEGVMSKAGHAIATGAKIAGAAIAAGLGVTAAIGFKEMLEGQRVTAQTNAVLKSTGGVANVTAKQVDRLATSIMKKSGIDDEAVKSGENLLLTFVNIRNEAGRGNDIFNQATEILTDMSIALGQDMSQSAIQLGKALNDPIRGVTALRRVGVSFTDAQTDQINAMVESGRTMDAQKLILRELTLEFGGSAEAAGKTLPGQLNILKETFSNVAGDIVSFFIPALASVGTFITDRVIPQFERFGDFIGRVFTARTFAAKINITWTGVRDLALDLYEKAKKAILGETTRRPIKLPSGKILEWDTRSTQGLWAKLRDDFPRFIAAIDWAGVGETIGSAIGRTIKFGAESLNSILETLSTWAEDHIQDLADIGAKIMVSMFITLTDPAFWAKNWKLALAVALSVGGIFTGGLSKLGLTAATALVRPLARISPLLARIFARAVLFIARELGRIPSILKEAFSFTAVYVFVSTVISALERLVNWVRGNWRKLVLAALSAPFTLAFARVRLILIGIEGVVLTVFNFFGRRVDYVRDKIIAVINKIRDMIDWIESIPGKVLGPLSKLGGLFGAVAGRIPGRGDFGSFGLGKTSLVALGRQLQSMGFSVSEHPAFGGVTAGAHVPGSYHYSGRAIDINWPGGGAAEISRLDWLASRLRRMPGVVEMLWRTAGHFDHLHLAMDRAGWHTLRPGLNLVGNYTGRPEPVYATGRGGRGPGATVNFYAPNYLGREETLMDSFRRMVSDYERRNGRSPF